MMRFANICDVDPAKCLVRVKFQDDGITSFWLPVIVQGSLENKYFHPLAINQLVAVMMDDNLENGVVLGAIYSANNQPNGGSADVTHIKFKDGTEIEYNTDASRLKVVIGATDLEMSAAGFTIKRGGEDLKAILSDLLAAIKAETHTTSTGPSGPPINLADFVAIEGRLPNLFE